MSKKIEKKALLDVAGFMCVAARTAPKAKGIDNIKTIVVPKAKIPKLVSAMKEIARRNNRPSCRRDADCIKGLDAIVVIGTKVKPVGLDCGFCNFKNCAELKKSGGVCAYNSLDLGIAIGSAVGTASDYRVDNRIMYSIGKAAIKLGLFEKSVKIAMGIPLSASGKNIFFDRK